MAASNRTINDGARPIGVFDSGIGGLTVAKAIGSLLPKEKIFYIGDTARVPYGGKSASTVERYSLEIVDLLLAENAKVVIIACNTASSLALPRLERTVPVPLLGVVEPGARAAAAATHNGRVGVIGTRATIISGAYESALKRFDSNLHVTSRACPLLVPLIEEGWLESPVTDQVIHGYLAPLVAEKIDTLVLGCTHYPLLRNTFARLLGPEITLVDSAENCAAATKELLEQKQLLTPKIEAGGIQVALTDAADNFLSVAQEVLQLNVGEVQLRQLN